MASVLVEPGAFDALGRLDDPGRPGDLGVLRKPDDPGKFDAPGRPGVHGRPVGLGKPDDPGRRKGGKCP